MAAGLDRSYVGGIERGERNPSYTNILRLTEALSIRASELIADAERAGADSGGVEPLAGVSRAGQLSGNGAGDPTRRPAAAEPRASRTR